VPVNFAMHNFSITSRNSPLKRPIKITIPDHQRIQQSNIIYIFNNTQHNSNTLAIISILNKSVRIHSIMPFKIALNQGKLFLLQPAWRENPANKVYNPFIGKIFNPSCLLACFSLKHFGFKIVCLVDSERSETSKNTRRTGISLEV
jgi:hypothetical protein